MSQENVEIVRRAFQAFNDRDLDGLLAMFAGDVEWRLIGGFSDLMGAEVRGRTGLRVWFTEWIENLGWRIEIDRAVEANDQVVVISTNAVRGHASGASVTQRFG